MSSAIKRLTKDYLEYQTNKDEFTLISAEPLENNLFEWHVNICAPDGPYANLPLHFILIFPENYPTAPPKVRLCTRINHPNVWKEYDGTDAAWICLDMLKEYTVKTKYEGWSSVYTLQSILLQLQSFLFSENVPQDYGGDSSLEYGNSSVVQSIERIKNFKCTKCGHCCKKPVPALPPAYCELLNTSVWKSGARILAAKDAVVNQNTVFWQHFPKWKTAAWDCDSLLVDAGHHKYQYEVKIDWGWNGFYREDIRIGWGVLTTKDPLNIKVIHESPADVGEWFWPSGMKVGDILTTAIDLQRKKVWYAVNGKLLPVQSYPRNANVGENLVPIFRFRACRLLLNFETPTKLIPRFRDAGFQILEPKVPIPPPSPDLNRWKLDNEACVDVFPPQVFQVIIEFLPMCDIINARASCGSVRSLIEEAAIIPRREVHCFVTKQTWKEATLGVGLTCTKNEKLTLEVVQPNMEFLALNQWEIGHRVSAWGEELTDFLVLPVSRMHCNMGLIIKYLEKFGAAYRLGGGHSAPEILNILSKLMNMCVVTMMKETEGGKCNEKLLVGYTQFHHLLLALNERYPEVAQLAQKRVSNFIKSDSYRHKKETPDLGKLLVMASLCPKLDWKKFVKTLFAECCRRRVMWYLKDSGALANVEASNEVYCQHVFKHTEISRGVVAFQIAFLKIFALPKEGETLSNVLSKYYLRYGQPRSADMAAFFTQAQKIVKCKTWKDHLEHVDMDLTGLELAHYLKSAVSRSLKAGYHRKQRNHGHGNLKSLKNGACAGLFRAASKAATDLESKAGFYLPAEYFSELKSLCEQHKAKLSLPIEKPFTGPITVASHTAEGLKDVQQALKATFPCLSLSPMKREYYELSFKDIESHEQKLKRAARECCVHVKFPKKFAFPIASVLGSAKGIEMFNNALQFHLQKPVVRKFSLKQHELCKRCDMTFPALHGAIVNPGSKGVKVLLKPTSEEPWGAFWDSETLQVQVIEEGGQFEKLGIEEGMKITNIQPCRSYLESGQACRFEVAHECGFVCRFCWPTMRNENKQFTYARETRESNKKLQQKRKAQFEERMESVKSKATELLFPATLKLMRLAKIREGYSLESKPVSELAMNTKVEVTQVQGNRAQISSPVKGWLSITTKNGPLLNFSRAKWRKRTKNQGNVDLLFDGCQFPALGEINIAEEAKISYRAQQTTNEAAKVKDPKRAADWNCRVCGAKGCFGSRQFCFKCNAPKSKSVSANNAKLALKNDSSKSASSSESGSSKSVPVETPAVPIKAGKSYYLLRAAVIREKMDKKSKWIANLEENVRVYVDFVDRKNRRARITSPYRGWISTWTQKGRLLK